MDNYDTNKFGVDKLSPGRGYTCYGANYQNLGGVEHNVTSAPLDITKPFPKYNIHMDVFGFTVAMENYEKEVEVTEMRIRISENTRL